MGTGRRSLIGALGVLLVAGTLGGITSSAGAASGPKHGGSITYSLEAETGGGFCLPGQSQLAASGIEVATSIYDTLTTINTKGQYVPFLAQAVTPNATRRLPPPSPGTGSCTPRATTRDAFDREGDRSNQG